MPPVSDSPHCRFLVDENLHTDLVDRLVAEGYPAEHAYAVGLRSRPDQHVFAYAQAAGAALITQDHDLERDTGKFPVPHAGIVIIELPQTWPLGDRIRRVIAALRSLADQSLDNTLIVIQPSQILVRRFGPDSGTS